MFEPQAIMGLARFLVQLQRRHEGQKGHEGRDVFLGHENGGEAPRNKRAGSQTPVGKRAQRCDPTFMANKATKPFV